MQGDITNNPIQYILNSELSGVLCKGFAELNRNKPNFPVSYLANWLKQYSQNQKNKKQSEDCVKKQREALLKMEQQKAESQSSSKAAIKKQQDAYIAEDQKYTQLIEKTQYLEDLLIDWLPQYIEKRYQFTGCYVGNLTHPYKPLQLNNFEIGAELDTEAPKVIEYIGTSKSHHQIMHMKILPSESGVSYDSFNEPQPQPQADEGEEGEQKKVREPKKTYIYVPDVTKNEKVYYFKFPRLGSYACFPLKLRSFLSQSSFDQGVDLYKQHLRQQQETKRQYLDKLNEIKAEFNEAKKKYEDFEIPQQPNPDAETQRTALKEQMDKAEKTLTQFESSAPESTQPNFPTIDKVYMVGVDTLGQDKKIQEQILNKIDSETAFFKKKFQEKQKQMLLKDIQSFIANETKADQLENIYRQIEKNAISHSQQVAKQKTTREKQLQFETSYAKSKKMQAVFEDREFEKSMQRYLSSNVPKYKQILQIGLMLVGREKKEINKPRTNTLDFRKVSNQQYIADFLKALTQYNLRPQQAPQCDAEYKISKLLERLQKFDLQQVLKYNPFIWALANFLKGICWCRMHCRDAHIEAYQLSIKAKQQRDGEIANYKSDLEKALEAHKAELGDNIEDFKEEQWIEYYKKQNAQPQQLNIIQQKQFLDLQ